MPLTPAQRQNAQLIYQIAVSRGVPRQRALELVAAAHAESGLDPNATNKSSGAAGFFQLLSQGYRDRAQQLGGLYNPRANTLAILPDYQNYWRSHPNARPGEAGRDVERSGMGADFYDDVGMFNWLGGGGSVPSPGVAAGTTTAPSPEPAEPRVDLRRQLALDLIQMRRSRAGGGRRDLTGVLDTIRQLRQPPPAQMAPAQTGPATPFPTANGNADYGPATMMALIAEAQRRGIRVGENPYTDTVDPVHVTNSLHYQTFPGVYNGRTLGRGADLTGTPEQLAGYFNWTRARYPGINELIYDPLGSVFNGRYSPKPYGGHRTHVHVGV